MAFPQPGLKHRRRRDQGLTHSLMFCTRTPRTCQGHAQEPDLLQLRFTLQPARLRGSPAAAGGTTPP